MEQNPYASPQSDSTPEPDDPLSPQMQARIAEEAKRQIREKQDRDTSWQLLATGIIGCFSPILAIYGIIFLIRRPYSFPLKTLAIAGTVLHCIWAALFVLMVLSNSLGPQM